MCIGHKKAIGNDFHRRKRQQKGRNEPSIEMFPRAANLAAVLKNTGELMFWPLVLYVLLELQRSVMDWRDSGSCLLFHNLGKTERKTAWGLEPSFAFATWASRPEEGEWEELGVLERDEKHYHYRHSLDLAGASLVAVGGWVVGCVAPLPCPPVLSFLPLCSASWCYYSGIAFFLFFPFSPNVSP